MSFPVSFEYKALKKLGLALSIQPSLYVGGIDNYAASIYWRGWIWSSVIGIHYNISKNVEVGFEYVYDINLYYCPECDDRFLTYRLFTNMPIGNNIDIKKNLQSSRTNKLFPTNRKST